MFVVCRPRDFRISAQHARGVARSGALWRDGERSGTRSGALCARRCALARCGTLWRLALARLGSLWLALWSSGALWHAGALWRAPGIFWRALARTCDAHGRALARWHVPAFSGTPWRALVRFGTLWCALEGSGALWCALARAGKSFIQLPLALRCPHGVGRPGRLLILQRSKLRGIAASRQ